MELSNTDSVHDECEYRRTPVLYFDDLEEISESQLMNIRECNIQITERWICNSDQFTNSSFAFEVLFPFKFASNMYIKSTKILDKFINHATMFMTLMNIVSMPDQHVCSIKKWHKCKPDTNCELCEAIECISQIIYTMSRTAKVNQYICEIWSAIAWYQNFKR